MLGEGRRARAPAGASAQIASINGIQRALILAWVLPHLAGVLPHLAGVPAQERGQSLGFCRGETQGFGAFACPCAGLGQQGSGWE